MTAVKVVCRCCGGRLKGKGETTGLCENCFDVPWRTMRLIKVLYSEGWHEVGFNVEELAEALAVSSSGLREPTERQQWVLGLYLRAAGSRLQVSPPEYQEEEF